MTKAPKAPTKPVTHEYVCKADGHVAGKKVKAGEVVELTERAARYENVELKAAKPAPKTAKASAAK